MCTFKTPSSNKTLTNNDHDCFPQNGVMPYLNHAKGETDDVPCFVIKRETINHVMF